MRNRANWVIGLALVGAVLLLIAAVALFGPVGTPVGDCGSVAAPGNVEDTRTSAACDEARSERGELVLLTGPLGVVLLAGALLVRSSIRRKSPTSAGV